MTTIDEITIEFEEEGIKVTQELDKEILSKGAWSTIIFKYQTWNREKGEYGPEQYSIRRYQKKGDQYLQRSKFNISSKEQAKKIIDVLTKWTGE